MIAVHPNFSSEKYGSTSHMLAQWIAHNDAYYLATGSEFAKQVISIIVGSSVENIAQSSASVDLRPFGNFTTRQTLQYGIYELMNLP